MISPARALCYKILKNVELRRAFSDEALNSDAMRQLEIRDRHLTTEIVYGTLRWQASLDYILSGVCSRPWSAVEPGARILLRMSLYQMWRMDRIPTYALVNDAVDLAKIDLGKGIDGFVNGICRKLVRTHPWKKKTILQQAPDSVRASLPEWLWKRWSARFGKKAAMEYALSLNSLPQQALRLAAGCLGPERLGFPVKASEWVPGAYIATSAISGLKQDGSLESAEFQIQDEASQLIPHLLNPLPGWKIWDACAAPGGKSAILSMLCGKTGYVVASDLKKMRIRRMRRLLKNGGTVNTHVLMADASRPAPFLKSFDAVLADVPCSGLGTMRRNPEIKWQFRPESFAGLQEVQRGILHNTAQMVRIGGRLLYSTCSTEPEENEQVIQSFLETHSGFRIMRPDFPPGIERWINRDQMVRTFPDNHLWDGFFAALLTRHS
ncbi:MAG: 16S rRNA (cytosine(967)-C(5))-methyltransferase RsmB [Acidobacteria bacterium]|nr:16S rRNA (cytosine(967)-C(5))-methyltransferase RsmB [Acidobacteriota bacterium]